MGRETVKVELEEEIIDEICKILLSEYIPHSEEYIQRYVYLREENQIDYNLVLGMLITDFYLKENHRILREDLNFLESINETKNALNYIYPDNVEAETLLKEALGDNPLLSQVYASLGWVILNEYIVGILKKHIPE